MKCLNLSWAMALVGLLLAGTTYGQTGYLNPSIARTAYDYYGDEDDIASPSDATKTPAKEEDLQPKAAAVGCDAVGGGAACDASASCGCDTCSGRRATCNLGCNGGCNTCCPSLDDCGDPWTLQRCDNCRGINYGGWVSFGVTINDFGNTTSDGNAPLGFNNDPNVNLNQLWGFLEREADNGGCGFDWGFRADFVFGVDGPDTQAFGDISWDNEWDAGGEYGSALPQLYLEAVWDDLSVKMGHFYTIIGYEVVQAPGNFFYSHSYAQYYAEPFTHTGFLMDYSVSDQWSIAGGFVYGWDTGFNNVNDAAMFLGGATWTSCDENTSLAYAVTAGNWGDGALLRPGEVGNDGDLYMHSLVLSHELGCNWTYVLQWDYAENYRSVGPDTSWYGLNNYLLKQINCCWAVGGRFEWFNDVDGARVGTGTAGGGDYYQATLGANWSPSANLRVRPEVRYDWFNGAGFPMDNGTEDDMFTFGVDAVFTF